MGFSPSTFSTPRWAIAADLPCFRGPTTPRKWCAAFPLLRLLRANRLIRQRFSRSCSRASRSVPIRARTRAGWSAAFKNVVAIAVGMSYGLGFGDNTAALLVSRGLAEMSRLVVACGGNAITCMGLAGTGDMVATCMSHHSRNRTFGEMLAAGKTLDDFTAETHMVAEGANACRNVKVLADRYGVDLPIADAVRSVVWEGADPKSLARDLTSRSLKPEFYGI